jgi:glycosyltransferase involved in cell wall biosynthesis
MVSFQHRMAQGLEKRGIQVAYDLEDEPYDGVLVIGGTRRLAGLWRARRRGIPVVQRLDGMNWMHKVRRTGVRHYVRAEYGNLLLAFIRARIANRVVYQSEFSKRWWERVRGPTSVRHWVVYNGIALDEYSPHGPGERPSGSWRIALVEGRLGGGYEGGLEAAVEMGAEVARRLKDAYSHLSGRQVEIMVVGRTSPKLMQYWRQRLPDEEPRGIRLKWAGLVSPERIPEIDRSAHLLYSADINAACPNAVIEAMACGTPVLAFDTGALPEMVQGKAGRVIPYGGDPWSLEHPDVTSLSQGALEILNDQVQYRRGARLRAEAQFGLQDMIAGYLQALS